MIPYILFSCSLATCTHFAFFIYSVQGKSRKWYLLCLSGMSRSIRSRENSLTEMPNMTYPIPHEDSFPHDSRLGQVESQTQQTQNLNVTFNCYSVTICVNCSSCVVMTGRVYFPLQFGGTLPIMVGKMLL